jgi:hypothetical protein
MTPTELLDLFRLETDDVAEPYLWSDQEFYTYLNEAQEIFVREIGGLSDRRSSLTNITYKIGDQFKKYDERILRISGAQSETNKFIGIRNYDNLTGLLSDDYGQQVAEAIDDTLTGPIRYLITDVEAKEIQLYPIPDNDGSLKITLKRLPLRNIEDGESILEINNQYHLSLLCWVKYKAFLKQDAETFEGSKSADFRAMFTEAVDLAKKEKRAREDRKRTVRYGGL